MLIRQDYIGILQLRLTRAVVAQPGRALDPIHSGVKLKTELS